MGQGGSAVTQPGACWTLPGWAKVFLTCGLCANTSGYLQNETKNDNRSNIICRVFSFLLEIS